MTKRNTNKLTKEQQEFLDRTFAENAAKFGGWSMELTEDPKGEAEEGNSAPEGDTGNAPDEIADLLKDVRAELEALREENSRLKESNSGLTQEAKSQYDQLRKVLMGRDTPPASTGGNAPTPKSNPRPVRPVPSEEDRVVRIEDLNL